MNGKKDVMFLFWEVVGSKAKPGCGLTWGLSGRWTSHLLWFSQWLTSPGIFYLRHTFLEERKSLLRKSTFEMKKTRTSPLSPYLYSLLAFFFHLGFFLTLLTPWTHPSPFSRHLFVLKNLDSFLSFLAWVGFIGFEIDVTLRSVLSFSPLSGTGKDWRMPFGPKQTWNLSNKLFVQYLLETGGGGWETFA